MKRRRTAVVWLCHGLLVTAFVPARIKRNEPRYFSRPSARSVAHPSTSQEQLLKHQNTTDRLWSYAYNIPRSTDRRSIHSLVAFLSTQQDTAASASMEPLERATIQAVRAASSMGDYRLIFRIVHASLDYFQGQPGLPPRLFGEAIESLSRTSCSVSKLKEMWRLSQDSRDLLKEPMGSFELNTMLRALAGRGKIRAALDLYDSTDITGDAYTMSTLLQALANSIKDDQQASIQPPMESPCWQYREGLQLLETCPQHQLNNHVFAAALALNDRAAQVFSTGQRHYAAQAAMDLLRLMKKRDISPDVVICSRVASTFDKTRQWKAAIAFLNAMETTSTSNKGWTLPQPNAHVYSSVLSACARCHQFNAAMQILGRLESNAVVRPNTWVYNAALSACVGGKASGKADRVRMALTLLREMESNKCVSDSISYNTVLAALDSVGRVLQDESIEVLEDFVDVGSSERCADEAIVCELLERMKDCGIERDALTYRNAVRAVQCNRAAVLHILDAASDDMQGSTKGELQKLIGRAAGGMTFVFNSALQVSSDNDWDGFIQVSEKMADVGAQADSETLLHLLTAVGRSHGTEKVPLVLQALDGNATSVETIQQEFRIDIRKQFTTLHLELTHYAAAITACLDASDIDNALQVLCIMRDKGLSPDSQLMQDIALTYCRLAIGASAEESKIGRRVPRAKKAKRTLQMDVKRRVAAARARNALEITLSLENPSLHLLSTVSKACSAAGMWEEARMLLSRLHDAALSEIVGQELESRSTAWRLLPGLHRSHLKICASKGNVTAALGFVDDIQALSKKYGNETIESDTLFSSFFDKDSSSIKDLFDTPTRVVPEFSKGRERNIGMTGEDWKLLLIAASKAGHWRLCLGTLQFLRPFLEATHPRHENESNQQWLTKRYDKLARSLTAAILCFEMRGQFAWALRAIDDWIEWSGRRPRKEAILATFRTLAAKGQGYEVNRLLARVLEVPSSNGEAQESRAAYEASLCIGAINSLHGRGLYDDADEVYLYACSRGYLDFGVEQVTRPSDDFVLDLHGMNVAIAHSAVRIALQQNVLSQSGRRLLVETPGDMIIVTGRGINSAQRLRPVLRPEVQRMLLEEFYPPLSTTSIPGNMGALRIPADDVKRWVLEQKQQKGARMLVVADVLKTLTSGDRIRRSIELGLGAESSDAEVDLSGSGGEDRDQSS